MIEDETLRSESLKLIQALRNAGCAVDYPLTPTKSDRQFKRAQELKATYTLRLERANDGQPVVRVKTMATRRELTLAPDEVAGFLQTHRC